jgi:hypothetical protein
MRSSERSDFRKILFEELKPGQVTMLGPDKMGKYSILQLLEYHAERPLAFDVTLAAAVTMVAAVLRLVKLGDIPYGVHPDEAQIGTDAFRISADKWIGVYSHAALGVPTLNAYLTWPGIWLLGHTAFSLRLPLALVGLAAVPLLYALVRVVRRIERSCGAAVAISYWHVFYSRVAPPPISYPDDHAARCIMLGLRRGLRWPWFARRRAAGSALRVQRRCDRDRGGRGVLRS